MRSWRVKILVCQGEDKKVSSKWQREQIFTGKAFHGDNCRSIPPGDSKDDQKSIRKRYYGNTTIGSIQHIWWSARLARPWSLCMRRHPYSWVLFLELEQYNDLAAQTHAYGWSLQQGQSSHLERAILKECKHLMLRWGDVACLQWFAVVTLETLIERRKVRRNHCQKSQPRRRCRRTARK